MALAPEEPVDSLEQSVLDALRTAGKPLRPGDVAQATGIDKERVTKAIASLKKAGAVISPKNCFYAPAVPES